MDSLIVATVQTVQENLVALISTLGALATVVIPLIIKIRRRRK